MKTAITPTREEDFAQWYQNVIKEAELAENSPTRGCMTIMPYGYAIWELIQEEMNKRIKATDTQNTYFPAMIPMSFFEKEAEHVEGFAKESAVITHYRLKTVDGKMDVDPEAKLTEPYILRPTSETMIGEATSRWIQSYRDLPMKLNQWANVFRWEMRTRIFLRSAEFLWQEGHCAFATEHEAMANVQQMLHVYGDFSKEILGVYSTLGEKTAEERFPGARHTFTREVMVQDGKALQTGTSHDLGQTFSKSFNIKFQSEEGKEEFAYTTSWGITTRMMGDIIAGLADDDGLVLPPKIAPHQVVILPFYRGDDRKDEIQKACLSLKQKLADLGIRALVDTTDARSSDKMWKWVKKGAPIRVEIGERELDAGSLSYVRRDIGKESKETLSTNDFLGKIDSVLEAMQTDIYEKHKAFTLDNTRTAKKLTDAEKWFKEGFKGFVLLPLSETEGAAFETVAEKYKVSRRCMPLDKPDHVIIAKSY
ncbi:MAG: proline--tRNA ligase [Alphaproteobacteria bacterium]|nr:proline--tRNA ligase [Alphaproteobacteria bacterium]MBN2780033.1 proline--tRNA ligase [Alphaproteobacteria bacterium]